MENIFSFDVFLINVPIYLAFILAGFMLAIKPKYNRKNYQESFSQDLYENQDLKVETAEDFEIYMQLAELARKEGKFNKAVKIHTRLLKQEGLSKSIIASLSLELGKDYLASGLLDKSEKHLIESLNITEKNSLEYKECLLEISKLYERQVDWRNAVLYREKLAKLDSVHNRSLALLLCNLAKEEELSKNLGNAKEFYQQALNYDEKCVLAVKELSNIYISESKKDEMFNLIDNYTQKSFKLVNLLDFALKELLKDDNFKEKTASLIKNILGDKNLSYEVHIIYLEYLLLANNIDEAEPVIEQYNEIYKDNLQAIYTMAKFLKEYSLNYNLKEDSTILLDKIENMLENSYNYQCSKCGYHTKHEFWHCPQCQEWDTVDRIHR